MGKVEEQADAYLRSLQANTFKKTSNIVKMSREEALAANK